MGQQDQHNHQTGSAIKVDIAQDLNWLLQSQPLMCATSEVSLFMPQDMPQEAADGANALPVSMRTYPAQPAYRLGKHFEDCVECLFAASSNNNIIIRNLVIQTPQRTIGELDLLYQNSAQEIVHLELAIKFYLLQKGGRQLDHFVGPAGHDRLDLKWDRLRQHQLPLSRTTQVLEFLQQQQLPLPTRHQLLLTGMLFYAYENWQATQVDAIGLNADHQRGWWLEHHELDQLKANPSPSGDTSADPGSDSSADIERGFIILPKWHWIGGPRHYSAPKPITYAALVELTTLDLWPNMVLVYERSHADWVFQNRGLVLATKKPPLVA